MRIKLDRRAAAELQSQFDYLIEHGASKAAQRLADRCDAFFENVLARHPGSGNRLADRDIWEVWIPGTRLVVWYRVFGDELQILRIWHSAQDRRT